MLWVYLATIYKMDKEGNIMLHHIVETADFCCPPLKGCAKGKLKRARVVQDCPNTLQIERLFRFCHRNSLGYFVVIFNWEDSSNLFGTSRELKISENFSTKPATFKPKLEGQLLF